jgi:hypothetical protein
MRFAILLASCVTACSGLSPVTRPPLGAAANTCDGGVCYSNQRCEELRDKYRTWGAVSLGSAALSGGGALATAFPDSQGARLGLGIGSAVVAVVSAVSVYLRDDTTKEFKDFCTRKAP